MADEVIGLRLEDNGPEFAANMSKAASSADMLDAALAEVFKSSTHTAAGLGAASTELTVVSTGLQQVASHADMLDAALAQAFKSTTHITGALDAAAAASAAAVPSVYGLAEGYAAAADAAKTFAASLPGTGGYGVGPVRNTAAEADRAGGESRKQFVKDMAGVEQAATRQAAQGWENYVVSVLGADKTTKSATTSIQTSARVTGGVVQQAGSQGAMGLMALSQTIDDAQYGFRSIVNNVPQVGMAIGQALGASTQSSMAFGAAMGIMAVAVNTNLQRLDEWKTLLKDIGGSDVFGPITRQVTELGDALNDMVVTLTGGGLSFSTSQMKLMGEAKAREEGRGKRADKALEEVGGIRDEATQRAGKAFREAVESQKGGGAELTARLTKRAEAGFGQTQLDEQVKAPGGGGEWISRREAIKRNVGSQMANALSGAGAEMVLSVADGGVKRLFEDMVKDPKVAEANKQARTLLKQLILHENEPEKYNALVAEFAKKSDEDQERILKRMPLGNASLLQGAVGRLQQDEESRRLAEEDGKQQERMQTMRFDRARATERKRLEGLIKSGSAGRPEVDAAYKAGLITDDDVKELHSQVTKSVSTPRATTFDQYRAFANASGAAERSRAVAYRQAQISYATAGMGGGQSAFMRAAAGFGNRFNRAGSGASRFASQAAMRMAGGRGAIEQRQRAEFEMQRIQNQEQAAQKRFVDVMERIGRDGIEVKG